MTAARVWLFAFLALAVLACSREPLKIDGESDAKARASIERITESLPIEQRPQFERAILAFLIIGEKPDEESTLSVLKQGPYTRAMLARLHGKTADQIFAESGIPRTAPVK